MLEVRRAFGAIEARQKNLREARFRRRTGGPSSGPALGIVDREGYRFQVALIVKSSFPDEALVFRIVGNRQQRFFAVCLAGPSQVGIEKGVGGRKQPRAFGRGLFAELHRQDQRGGHNYDR